MIEDHFSLMRSHYNSVGRYRKLLTTHLSDLERQFLEQRLAEERSALESLIASTFPLTFREPAPPAIMEGS
jgi:hypothetical protein